jgi:DNA-binding IclR family transcriptional regulator
MARPALSASRSIDVLDFLAAFPGRAFTLSEIARAAKINVASCHAVLTALTARGYLTRDAKNRGYVLGPALVAVGQAALKSQPLVDKAQGAAEDLFRELKVPVLLSAIVGDEIVGIVSIADAAGHSPGLRVGQRMPLVPPSGAPFLAWSSEQAIEAWIAKKPKRSERTSKQLKQTLALTRKRGFQVTLGSPESSELSALLAEMASRRQVHEYKDQVYSLLSSLDRHLSQPEVIVPKESYDVLLIAAPIFDENGAAAFSLCLGGFAEKITGATIQKYADHLLRACLKVMRSDLALRA